MTSRYVRILAATSAAVAATAATGSAASRTGVTNWYAQLRKPAYVPPNSVFPVVWTILYTAIAVTSAAAIDRLRNSGSARGYAAALAANLAVNAGWSWLFFRYQRLGVSAIAAAVLAASSADLNRMTSRADRIAGLALLPYPLWCAFATVMSTNTWLLNRHRCADRRMAEQGNKLGTDVGHQRGD